MPYDLLAPPQQNRGILDPTTAALLQAGFAGLAASGPQRRPVGLGQVAGQAGQAGLGAYQAAEKQKLAEQMMAAKAAEEKRLHDAQIGDLAAKAEQRRQETALQKEQSEYLQRPEVQAAIKSGNVGGVLAGMPKLEARDLSMLVPKPKPSPYGTVSPKDYTRDSFAKFSQTGNHADLVPIGKEDELAPVLRAAGIEEGSPQWKAAMQARANKLSTHAKAASATATVTTASDPFAKKVGEKLGEEFVESKKDAQLAVASINNLREGRALLDSGVITGIGADLITKGGQVLQRIGIPLGKNAEETISNTQSYAANMGREVGSVIRLFGSGTGLSDADREYAQKIAGGEISLNEDSLRKLLDINERVAIAKVNAYNQRGEEFLKTPEGKAIPRSQVLIDMPASSKTKHPGKSASVEDWITRAMRQNLVSRDVAIREGLRLGKVPQGYR
jgi:hypothetical protein